MWTSCAAINAQVCTTEGTIPLSVNIFCLRLVLQSSKHVTLAKVSSANFAISYCCCAHWLSLAWVSKLYARCEQIPDDHTDSWPNKGKLQKRRGRKKMLDFNRLLLASKWAKRSYAFWAVKSKRPLQCLCKAPFKNILKIIALFFATMIIYSTRTKLPAM